MTYKEFVERRLEEDEDEPRPVCPFVGGKKMGYCDSAYTARCYACDESLDEYIFRYCKKCE